MSDRVAIYTATPPDDRPHRFALLTDAEAHIVKRVTGSREYYAGEVHTHDDALIDRCFDARIAMVPSMVSAWIVWGETFIRIWSMWRDTHPGATSHGFVCDQSHSAAIYETPHGWIPLRIVEPSPPHRNGDDGWWEAERARAIRDFETARFDTRSPH